MAEASRLVAESREIAQAGGGAITDHLATFVAVEYAAGRSQWGDDRNQSAHWKRLRALCHDVATLRRCDQYAESLQLQRQQLALRLLQNPPLNQEPREHPDLK